MSDALSIVVGGQMQVAEVLVSVFDQVGILLVVVSLDL